MPALIAIAALAFLAELAGIMRCAVYGVPFGRGFGYSILAQFILPVLIFALFALWGLISPPTLGIEPLTGDVWSRFDAFISSVFFLEFLATLAAGVFGFDRFSVPPPPIDDNTRNA